MKVRMVNDRTGGRYDDQAWPPRGGEFDVPDEEAADLIRQGDAEPVTEAVVTEAVAEPAETVTPVTPDPVTAVTSPESQDTAGDIPSPPIINAPKAHWEDFAVSTGFDRGIAESMTKADLIARFRNYAGAPDPDADD